jgi:glycine/D-amino acid oxidase-like deaminating enzyme
MLKSSVRATIIRVINFGKNSNIERAFTIGENSISYVNMSSMNSPALSKTYLLIGQGITGSVLAWCLLKAGHRVVIVDANHHEASSIISAGIRNPITGQRLAVTPQFDLFAAHADSMYSQISAELGSIFFIPKPIIRVLRNHEEVKRCRYLNTLPSAQPYIGGIHPEGYYGKAIHDPFGTLTISRGGYFQTQLLLKALKKYFIERKMLVEEHFVYDDLKLIDQEVVWKSQRFDAVIFCEGFKAKQNPWFKELPYNFAKGELLKIAFDSHALPDAILCQQQWCLPALDGTYLAGATYDRLNIDTMTTPEGQAAILKGLSDFIPATARVLERYAAVRPVMLNQKPVVAMHPSIPRLGIFNGFGSKGFLWAPYYAETFGQQLCSSL